MIAKQASFFFWMKRKLGCNTYIYIYIGWQNVDSRYPVLLLSRDQFFRLRTGSHRRFNSASIVFQRPFNSNEGTRPSLEGTIIIVNDNNRARRWEAEWKKISQVERTVFVEVDSLEIRSRERVKVKHLERRLLLKARLALDALDCLIFTRAMLRVAREDRGKNTRRSSRPTRSAKKFPSNFPRTRGLFDPWEKK